MELKIKKDNIKLIKLGPGTHVTFFPLNKFIKKFFGLCIDKGFVFRCWADRAFPSSRFYAKRIGKFPLL